MISFSVYALVQRGGFKPEIHALDKTRANQYLLDHCLRWTTIVLLIQIKMVF